MFVKFYCVNLHKSEVQTVERDTVLEMNYVIKKNDKKESTSEAGG